LLPIVLLALVSALLSLRGWLGLLLGPGAIGWCTWTSTRFFENAMAMPEQRFLVTYPVGLLYACFALLSVF
jgi:hypothetical protein